MILDLLFSFQNNILNITNNKSSSELLINNLQNHNKNLAELIIYNFANFGIYFCHFLLINFY